MFREVILYFSLELRNPRSTQSETVKKSRVEENFRCNAWPCRRKDTIVRNVGDSLPVVKTLGPRRLNCSASTLQVLKIMKVWFCFIKIKHMRTFYTITACSHWKNDSEIFILADYIKMCRPVSVWSKSNWKQTPHIGTYTHLYLSIYEMKSRNTADP